MRYHNQSIAGSSYMLWRRLLSKHIGLKPLLYCLTKIRIRKSLLNHYYYPKTILDLACSIGDLSSVIQLVHLNLWSFHWSLHWANRSGNLNLVKWLCSIGCNPFRWHDYLIGEASGLGNLHIVKFLHKIGCDPTEGNNNAIRLASRQGHLHIVKFLTHIGCTL